MARILLSAYACEPGRGSEPGVGWGWANELAREGHRVTVLTRGRKSRRHRAGDKPTRPQARASSTTICHGGCRGIRRFPGGKPALLRAVAVVRRSHVATSAFPSPPFDIVQHVTYVSIPLSQLHGYAWHSVLLRSGIRWRNGSPRASELDSRLEVGSVRQPRATSLTGFLRLGSAGAAHLGASEPNLCDPRHADAASETRLDQRANSNSGRGASVRTAPLGPNSARNEPELRLLYVGRLLDWKGIDLALQGHKVERGRTGRNVSLTIVGDGPARLPSSRRLCRNLELNEWCALGGLGVAGQLAQNLSRR